LSFSLTKCVTEVAGIAHVLQMVFSQALLLISIFTDNQS
jgi:hypothetical protein